MKSRLLPLALLAAAALAAAEPPDINGSTIRPGDFVPHNEQGSLAAWEFVSADSRREITTMMTVESGGTQTATFAKFAGAPIDHAADYDVTLLIEYACTGDILYSPAGYVQHITWSPPGVEPVEFEPEPFAASEEWAAIEIPAGSWSGAAIASAITSLSFDFAPAVDSDMKISARASVIATRRR